MYSKYLSGNLVAPEFAFRSWYGLGVECARYRLRSLNRFRRLRNLAHPNLGVHGMG